VSQINEYDVHFSLNGFYGAVEAESKEKAIAIVHGWIDEKINDIEAAMKTGVGTDPENFEAVDIT